mgnify:CR=1 FL=1
MKSLTIFVDIDGTICNEGPVSERARRKPLPGARAALKKMRKDGHVVVLWTAREWTHYKLTKKWLDKHGFEYDQILMGKPVAHVWIDDRAREFKGWDKDYISDILSQYD